MTIPIDRTLLAVHEYDELIFGGYICTHCTPDDADDPDDNIPFPCPTLRDAGMTDEMSAQVIKAHRQQVEANGFNERFPIGTPVRYWTGVREGEGKVSKTRTEAQVLGGHTAVVWVEDEASCIALTHVRVLADAEAAR